MSISLYRKYRSQTFAEVVGQGHITDTLAQAVTEGRLHHAYLFTGPRGTGKTSTARILAKSLNCEQGPTAEPCNACPHCEAITSGSHVDVIEIDAASHGGVDDVRDLRDRVAFAPAQARTKVYIVDECHMLSTAGWNAFLKTLEEPPGHVVFVFATTEPHKVLSTILSRTQRFDFKRIDTDALTALTADLAAREGIAFEDGALDLIVHAGDGSARDTLSVLDQVVAFTGSRVTVQGIADVLGSIPQDMLIEVADCVAAGDVAGACSLVGRAADAGYDLRQFAKDVVEHLRSLFLLQVAPDGGLVSTTPERLERLREQAGRIGRTEALRAMELLTDAQAQMRRGATRLALEIALAKATMPEISGDPGALAARLDRLERSVGAGSGSPAPPAGTSPSSGSTAPAGSPAPSESATASESGAAPEPVSEPAAVQAPENGDPAPLPAESALLDPEPEPEPSSSRTAARVDLEAIEGAWDAVLDNVKQHRRALHAYLLEAWPVAYDDKTLTLEFGAKYSIHAEQCAKDASRAAIGAALERVLGIRPDLHCTVAEGESATAGPAAGGARRRPERASATADTEAEAVAESEAAEAEGAEPDDATAYEDAIGLLQSELGAVVIDDERS